jgi:hypothetical protein
MQRIAWLFRIVLMARVYDMHVAGHFNLGLGIATQKNQKSSHAHESKVENSFG